MWKKLSRMMSQVMGREQPGRRRVRPAVECLEDRAVPTTIAVTTFADVVNPNDQVVSLREAINLANATPGSDTILLQAGVYKITRAGADDANVSGDFDVLHSLSIVGRGAGATAIQSDLAGPDTDRLFEAFGPIDMTFANLTLRNGGNHQLAGGAVAALAADITLNHVRATGNSASQGGAINAGSGDVTLNYSVLTNNFAQGSGGGIWAGQGNVRVTGGRLTSNTASTENGGAIDAEAGDVTLVHSTVDRNFASVNGGGIHAPLGTLTLNESTLRFNVAGRPFVEEAGVASRPRAGKGGGAFAGVVNASHSTISANTAFAAGGGINATTVSLNDSTVSGNQAGDGGGVFAVVANVNNSTVSGNNAAGGGGINATTVNLTRSTVSGNNAMISAGGGIKGDTVNLTGSTVRGNTSHANGGGVFAVTASSLNSTVSGNTAGGGGGGINATTVNLTSSTISGNRATSGGGIFASAGALLSSTIVENIAAIGGGVRWAGGADHIHVKNTIIADNSLLAFPEVGRDVSGDFVSDGHNLIGVVEGGTGFGAAGDLLGHINDPLDPRLGALANNGGPTRTHALLAGSPAIDHGDNTGALGSDQRGLARSKDGDGDGGRTVDIGAFER